MKIKMKKGAIKLFTKFSLLNLFFIPVLSFAQFVVEEERETPSKFAQQGLETLNNTVAAINVFLGLLFLFSIIGLLIAGVRFVIAGGSEEMLNSARTISMASVMGIIFSLIGYILVNSIKHFVI